MDQSASVPFCFLAADSGAWSHGFLDVKIWGFGYGKRDLWCNHYHPRQHWLGQLQGCNFDDFKRPSRHWNMANAKGMLWMEDTHTISQHPTTDVTFHVFLHHPFLKCHPARSVWVMRAWPTFKTRRATKKSQELVDRGILYGGFSSSPLWHLSPKMGGGNFGGIQSHCQPRFFWNVLWMGNHCWYL